MASQGWTVYTYYVCAFLCLLSAKRSVGSRVLFAVKLGPGEYDVVEGHEGFDISNAFVSANFTDYVQGSGWSFLDIKDVRNSTSGVEDDEVAYFAGQFEANCTANLIHQQWLNTMANYCSDHEDLCHSIAQFIKENQQFVMSKLQNRANLNDPYWYQVHLFQKQLSGLIDGCADRCISGSDLDPNIIFMIFQLHGDLDDLETKFGKPTTVGSGSCSALVKLLPHDLLVGHSTWTSYYNMLRIFKRYQFRFSTSKNNRKVIPGHTQVFSSYPGRLYSGDDFYLISSQLLTMETSIENHNADLWKLVSPMNSVFENIRVTVANRLATTGKEWTDTFSSYNSGTYNNQWMIVDYNHFYPGSSGVESGLLWVLEQMPKKIVSKDLTPYLKTHSYWASYNIPYFEEIYKYSHTDKQSGDWYSWQNCPRAKMFARNQTAVNDLNQMLKLMRYNNFQYDELSKCDKCSPPYSAENAIAARSDLNSRDGKYPFKVLGHRAHGAIDAKVVNYEMLRAMQCWAESGPTHDQQPVFKWSTSGFSIPIGQPDEWNFNDVFIRF